MRKIVAGLFISLDGVVEAPEKWGFKYIDNQVSQWITEGIAQADAVLLGPGTYREFAKVWPNQSNDVPMATFLNQSAKYVMTRRPSAVGDLAWHPAALLRGALSEEVSRLKALPGKNIQVPGSPRLVRSLLSEGLLDELHLGICPVVVGPGLRLFEEVVEVLNLDLVKSKTFGTGLISLAYRPISADIQSPKQSLDFPDSASRRK